MSHPQSPVQHSGVGACVGESPSAACILSVGLHIPQDAIERVRALEAEGRLTGVMDDRGKYIYISREEMAAVADFLTRRGRVAIAELAAQVWLQGSCKSLPYTPNPTLSCRAREWECDDLFCAGRHGCKACWGPWLLSAVFLLWLAVVCLLSHVMQGPVLVVCRQSFLSSLSGQHCCSRAGRCCSSAGGDATCRHELRARCQLQSHV